MPPSANTTVLPSCRTQSEQQMLSGPKLRSEQSEQNHLRKSFFQLRPCSDFPSCYFEVNVWPHSPVSTGNRLFSYETPPSPLPSSPLHRNSKCYLTQSCNRNNNQSKKPLLAPLGCPSQIRNASTPHPSFTPHRNNSTKLVRICQSEQNQSPNPSPRYRHAAAGYESTPSHAPSTCLNRNITPSCLKAAIGTMPGPPGSRPRSGIEAIAGLQ